MPPKKMSKTKLTATEDSAPKRARQTLGPRVPRCGACFSCLRMSKYKCVGPEGSEADQMGRLRAHLLQRDMQLAITNEPDGEKPESEADVTPKRDVGHWHEDMVKFHITSNKLEDMNGIYNIKVVELTNLLDMARLALNTGHDMQRVLGELGHPDAATLANSFNFHDHARSAVDKDNVSEAHALLNFGISFITDEIAYIRSCMTNNTDKLHAMEERYTESCHQYWNQTNLIGRDARLPKRPQDSDDGPHREQAPPVDRDKSDHDKLEREATQEDVQLLDALLEVAPTAETTARSSLSSKTPRGNGANTNKIRFVSTLTVFRNRLQAHLHVCTESDDAAAHVLVDSMIMTKRLIDGYLEDAKEDNIETETMMQIVNELSQNWYCTD